MDGPQDLKALGYSMVLYPTTVIFRVTRAIQKAVEDLKAGRPMAADDAVTFEEYEEMLRLPQWADVENAFEGAHDPRGVPLQGSTSVLSSSTPAKSRTIGARG